MNYYLGKFVWGPAFTDAEGKPTSLMAWMLPEGVTAALDMRPFPEQAIPGDAEGQLSDGSALFVTETTLKEPHVLLAENAKGVLTVEAKQALGKPVQAETLDEALFELLTLHADPTGATGPKPLMPGTDGTLRLRVGDVLVEKPLTVESAEWPAVQAGFQAQYREAKARAEDPTDTAAVDLHLKQLSIWMDRLKVADHGLFIPDDLPKDVEPKKPQTSHSDHFNTADSATVGAQLSWSELVGTWGNNSNACRLNDGDGYAFHANIRADADVSSNDHSVSAAWVTNVVTSGGYAGIMARYSGAANTAYIFFFGGTNGSTINAIYKIVAGTLTSLATGSASFMTSGQTQKLTVTGSALEGFVDGASKLTHTDSAITTGTRGGLDLAVTVSGVAAFDDYLIDDGLSGDANARLIGGDLLNGGLLFGRLVQ